MSNCDYVSFDNYEAFVSFDEPANTEDAAVKVEESGVEEAIQFQEMVSGDESMYAVFEKIERAASANVPVFIHGETGTGKELAAKACHTASANARKPFIAVNCANFSEELMESQLFGHKRGAFTGANGDHAGLLETVGEGTIFLDEVTTLSLPLQAKLLRVIQEREFTPVGSHKSKKFSARIVSASSTSLVDAVSAGTFREDLLYRLGVITLNLPSLRERKNDKTRLALYFLDQISNNELKNLGKELCYFSQDALDFIESYAWPGNVRQLRNVILGTLVMSSNQEIKVEELKAQVNEVKVNAIEIATAAPALLEPANRANVVPLWQIEKQAIEEAIDACEGNIPRAAAALEVSPSTIYRKLQSWEAA